MAVGEKEVGDAACGARRALRGAEGTPDPSVALRGLAEPEETPRMWSGQGLPVCEPRGSDAGTLGPRRSQRVGPSQSLAPTRLKCKLSSPHPPPPAPPHTPGHYSLALVTRDQESDNQGQSLYRRAH